MPSIVVVLQINRFIKGEHARNNAAALLTQLVTPNCAVLLDADRDCLAGHFAKFAVYRKLKKAESKAGHLAIAIADSGFVAQPRHLSHGLAECRVAYASVFSSHFSLTFHLLL